MKPLIAVWVPDSTSELPPEPETVTPPVLDAVKEYAALAREHGMTPAQMALAWCYSRWFVASTIIGATTLAQLKENIDALEVNLPLPVLEAIDAIHARIMNPGA